jgi:putative toxin-antitoxin system antitoxin component (TIGR02293 family)
MKTDDASSGSISLISSVWESARTKAARGLETRLFPRDLAKWGPQFSTKELESLVIPKRTLARRSARREALTSEETDRALRLARIGSEADRVFANPEKAARWLRRPNPALAGQTPLSLLKTEAGARAVDDILGQIDHGLFI